MLEVVPIGQREPVWPPEVTKTSFGPKNLCFPIHQTPPAFQIFTTSITSVVLESACVPLLDYEYTADRWNSTFRSYGRRAPIIIL